MFNHISKHREESLNTTRSGVFLANFEVFGNVVKHCLECLIYLLSLICAFERVLMIVDNENLGKIVASPRPLSVSTVAREKKMILNYRTHFLR